MGLYREENAIDTLRGKLRVFSVLITWALENGIITADSMEARGYGTARRTQLRRFVLTRGDALFLAVSLGLAAVTAAALGTGALHAEFYPYFEISPPGMRGVLGLAAYALLVLLPVLAEGEVRLRWRSLQSKI